MKKHLFSFLLIALLLCALLSVTALAEDGGIPPYGIVSEADPTLQYSFSPDSGELLIYAEDGKSGHTLPASFFADGNVKDEVTTVKIKGCKVLEPGCFADFPNLTTVKIDECETIGGGCFRNTGKINFLVLGDEVSSVGEGAFASALADDAHVFFLGEEPPTVFPSCFLPAAAGGQKITFHVSHWEADGEAAFRSSFSAADIDGWSFDYEAIDEAGVAGTFLSGGSLAVIAVIVVLFAGAAAVFVIRKKETT